MAEQLVSGQEYTFTQHPLFFQIIVTGSPVILEAKAATASTFTQIAEYTESVWDKAEEFPASTYKFTIPAGAEVHRTQ